MIEKAIASLIAKALLWLHGRGLHDYIRKVADTTNLRAETSTNHAANVEAINELMARVGTLEQAYAEDPRRKEIEKEKAAEPTSLGGFLPRSARRSRWEASHAKKPIE